MTSQEQCYICFENLNNINATMCENNHKVCLTCFSQYVRNNNDVRCGLCRQISVPGRQLVKTEYMTYKKNHKHVLLKVLFYSNGDIDTEIQGLIKIELLTSKAIRDHTLNKCIAPILRDLQQGINGQINIEVGKRKFQVTWADRQIVIEDF